MLRPRRRRQHNRVTAGRRLGNAIAWTSRRWGSSEGHHQSYFWDLAGLIWARRGEWSADTWERVDGYFRWSHDRFAERSDLNTERKFNVDRLWEVSSCGFVVRLLQGSCYSSVACRKPRFNDDDLSSPTYPLKTLLSLTLSWWPALWFRPSTGIQPSCEPFCWSAELSTNSPTATGSYSQSPSLWSASK